jgi:hypothetical protein
VSVLVEGGGGHVLSVASAAKNGESGVVQVAVDNQVLAGESVGQDVGAARVENVRAVLVGGTAGGAGALRSDSTEAGGNGAASGRGGGLEVLGEPVELELAWENCV